MDPAVSQERSKAAVERAYDLISIDYDAAILRSVINPEGSLGFKIPLFLIGQDCSGAKLLMKDGITLDFTMEHNEGVRGQGFEDLVNHALKRAQSNVRFRRTDGKGGLLERHVSDSELPISIGSCQWHPAGTGVVNVLIPPPATTTLEEFDALLQTPFTVMKALLAARTVAHGQLPPQCKIDISPSKPQVSKDEVADAFRANDPRLALISPENREAIQRYSELIALSGDPGVKGMPPVLVTGKAADGSKLILHDLLLHFKEREVYEVRMGGGGFLEMLMGSQANLQKASALAAEHPNSIVVVRHAEAALRLRPDASPADLNLAVNATLNDLRVIRTAGAPVVLLWEEGELPEGLRSFFDHKLDSSPPGKAEIAEYIRHELSSRYEGRVDEFVQPDLDYQLIGSALEGLSVAELTGLMEDVCLRRAVLDMDFKDTGKELGLVPGKTLLSAELIFQVAMEDSILHARIDLAK